VLVIGLTGGIGTGKTEVTHILRELGAVVIESDKVAHLSYRPGTEAYRAIVNQFGRKILDDSGVIDRTSLGAIVFSDRAQREELESIVWPAARKWIENRLVEEERRGSQVVVIEVPKLFEAGWDQFTNVVWTVEATHGEIGQRVRERAGLTEAETDARVAAQMTCEERIARADLVIENNSTLEDLRERVIKTWETVPALESANPK
jgi:dephospho-CoA kinase